MHAASLSENVLGSKVQNQDIYFYLLTNWLAYLYGRIQIGGPRALDSPVQIRKPVSKKFIS